MIPHPTLGLIMVNSDSCVQLGGAFLEFGTVHVAGKLEGSCILEAHRLRNPLVGVIGLFSGALDARA